MVGKFLAEITLPRRTKSFFLAALSFVLLSGLSGCTVNRVSILSQGTNAKAVEPSEVKFYSSFNDIDEPWQLEGMISAYTLPIASNSTEKREALVRTTAASLGANAVVGLEPNLGDGIWRTGRAEGLLATTGTRQRESPPSLAKFIVCLPPVHFNIERNASTNGLDAYLREHIQYFFSYAKGYYVYRWSRFSPRHRAPPSRSHFG